MTARPHLPRPESAELEETHTHTVLGSGAQCYSQSWVLVLRGVMRVTGHRDLRDSCPGPSLVSPGPRSKLRLKSGGDR